MRIKDLPQEIKELALLRQKQFKNVMNADEHLLTAFEWKLTPEKKEYWGLVTLGKFSEAKYLLKA